MKTANPLALLSLTSLLACGGAAAADWPQWRGPARNGVSTETGLLQEWPAEGPKLVWKINHAGSGYAAPAIVGDRIYLLGNQGLENEFVLALDAKDGRRLWSTRLGNVGNPKQNPNFPAARSTPTVDGAVLYALGSDGDLACLDTATGAVRWKKSLRSDFAGKPGEWAYAESPLVDGDTLICTPGGGEATVLALNKRTGDVLWKCATPEGDEAGYASAIALEVGGVPQYVQLLQKGLVGVDAKTGRLLWRFDKATSRYNANIPSPLADRDIIYCASAGTGGGAVRVRPANDGVKAEALYFEAKLPTAIGGAVKVGNWLFGTSSQAMLCADFATGQIKWEDRALGAGALIYADGRLYLNAESGPVALIEPTPDGYREKGRFTPPDRPKRISPMEKAWAYPALSAGRLYLRDHGMVWCYDVKAGG